MLDTSNYSVSNALTYKLFYGHFKEATNAQGTLSSRICHAGLAALELFPIVGQIVALFELAVVKTFGLAKGSCCKDLKDSKIEKPEDNIIDSDSIPAIPARYALYALAFVVIAPFAIYAIASKFIPAELLAEPANLAQNLTDASSESTVSSIFNTLYSYLPGTADKLEGVTAHLPSIPPQPIDFANILPSGGDNGAEFLADTIGPRDIFIEAVNIVNPALNKALNTTV